MTALETANHIKALLRKCKTVDEIEAVADEHRATVKAMAETDKALAIQIANLKAYMIDGIINHRGR